MVVGSGTPAGQCLGELVLCAGLVGRERAYQWLPWGLHTPLAVAETVSSEWDGEVVADAAGGVVGSGMPDGQCLDGC